MKLLVSFGSAFALHAAVVTGVMLGHPLATHAPARALSTAVVEVDALPPPTATFRLSSSPVVQPARVVRAQTAAPVPVVSVKSESASRDDVVPDPVAPVAPPHFKGAFAMAAVTVAPSEATRTFDESEVTERAVCVAAPQPVYPQEALTDEIEAGGPLHFELVVDAEGRVADVRAKDHPGHGFEEAALAALRRHRFTPAKRDGQAVRVRMPWTVEFRAE